MSKLTDLLVDPDAERHFLTLTYAYDPINDRGIAFPISTQGFTPLPTEVLANVHFAPRIPANGVPTFQRSLFGQGRLSGSSDSPETALVAIAADGEIDYFHDYAWAGRRFELYLGGDGFAFSEYGLVMVLAAQEPAYTDKTITIPLRDISFLLDREMQSVRYAGTGGAEGSGELANRLKPDVLGFCSKVPPVYLGLDANGRHMFGVGSRPIVGVLRVSDRGSFLTFKPSNPGPGEYTVDLIKATITLGGAFEGPIQADVIGRRVLELTSSSAVTVGTGLKTFAVPVGSGSVEVFFAPGMRVRCLSTANPTAVWMDGIVTTPRPGGTLAVQVYEVAGSGTVSSWTICPWGTAANIMMDVALGVLGDQAYIDFASWTALNNILPATCGYWVPEGMNGKQFLDLIAEGACCYWYITRINTFRVGRINLPTEAPATAFDETAILSVERVPTDEPIWQVVIKCQRKWSLLTIDQIAGVANPAEFTEEWTTLIGSDPNYNKLVYRSERTIEIETIFYDFDVAQTELFRQFNLFGQRRDYFRITQKRELMSLALTNVVRIEYPRYGLGGGKALRLIDLTEDYSTGLVTMGLWG